MQDGGGAEVEREPDHADGEHPAAARLERIAEALDRLDDDPDRDRDERDAVRERGEDLRAPVAEAPLGRRRPRAEPGREQREPEAPTSPSMWPASARSASESAT